MAQRPVTATVTSPADAAAAVAVVEGLGRAPATTAQARRILGVRPAARAPLAFGSRGLAVVVRFSRRRV
jgi:hypothetical protein